MNAFLKFLIGAAIVAALGILSIHASVLPGSRQDAVRKLEAIATERLNEGGDGAGWAKIDSHGQKVVISGEAPDSQAPGYVTALLRGNLITGPITAVDKSTITKVELPPLADPHIWIAEHQGDALVLSGDVPSQAARDAIFQLAAMRFSDAEISGSLDIARSTTSEESWSSAASIALQALARLESGAVEIVNNEISITGQTIDRARADAISDLLDAAPEGFTVKRRISVAAPTPTVTAAPDIIPEEVAEVSTDATPTEDEPGPEVADTPVLSGPPTPSLAARPEIDCRENIADTINGQPIEFESSEIALKPDSRRHLDAVAEALVACSDISIIITGHTDASGGARRNLTLSLYRADAVAAYLRSLGVAPGRMTTRGAGESEPIATNGTRAGRAQNRRIEFDISDTTAQETE